MGKIICEECGKEFDDTNEVCPNCGYERNKKKNKLKIIIPIVVLFLLIILIIVLVNRNGKNNVESVDNAQLEQNETFYNLGEIVSTDILDFTLNEATFSYYASSILNETYATAISESSGGIFVANKGYTLVPCSFTVKNKDRANLNIASWDWAFNFKVNYQNNSYSLKSFDLNDKSGSSSFSLYYSMISSNGGKLEKCSTSNYIMDPDETLIIQTVGIVSFEPDTLDDDFSLTINLPNSNGELEYFTYKIIK